MSSQSSPDEPLCPKCGSRLWDNRLSKRNPKAPDGKCRSRTCDGVLWKWGEANRAGRTANADEQEPPPDDDFDPSVGF